MENEKKDLFEQDQNVYFYGKCAACRFRFRPVQECKDCIYCSDLI